MNEKKREFSFTSNLWVYSGKAAWYFVTLPKELSEEIDFYHGHMKAGWGSLPVKVVIGESEWQTSIFPDKKAGAYMLPVKKKIREKERLKVDGVVKVSLSLRL